MEILGIIPARGTSVRLPRKNIKLLNGRPLIAYTIEQAQASSLLSRIIVTTDDDEIESIAKQYNADVIHSPETLHREGNEVSMLRVVQHTLSYLSRYGGYQPLVVVILQITSPLRTVQDIDNTIKLMLETGANSAETMCGGKENGAVYVSRRFVVTEQNAILGSPLVYYDMPAERSVDIDTQEDFDRAERLLKGEKIDNHSGVLHKLDRPSNGKGDDKGRKGKRGRPRKIPTL